MDANYNRHGKKTDQETQSPVLKVFKEMIQRENNDPEKATLLKEKQDRKRRQYSGSRSKSDHRLQVNHHSQRVHESSSSERHKRNIQYKVPHHDHKNREYTQCRTQSIPFQGDTKDSWWFWGGDNKRQQQQQQPQCQQSHQQNKETKKKLSEDTCSCVSCALKKLVSSEYACMACLGLLFCVSVMAAFLIVFKAVPITASLEKSGNPAKLSNNMKSDVLKKKIDLLQNGRGYGDEAALRDPENRRPWDDTASRHANGIAGLTANDYGDTGYRDWSSLEDSGLAPESELSTILDAEKVNEGMTNDKLKNFYKKLIKTDAQIRKLKKSSSDYPGIPLKDGKFNFLSDRRKRSLRVANSKGMTQLDIKKSNQATEDELFDISKFNLYFPPFSAVTSTVKSVRKAKRFINGTDEPSGYLLEKKQILVQYKPNALRKVPKCSHVPKDSKSHEKQLKHPFYKNSQRLDEMLDQILDRKLPEIMADPFGVENLFSKEHKKATAKPHNKAMAEKVKAYPPFEPKFVISEVGPSSSSTSAERRPLLDTNGPSKSFIPPIKQSMPLLKPSDQYDKGLFSANNYMPHLKPSDQHDKDLFSAKKFMPLLKTSDQHDKDLFSAKSFMPLLKTSDRHDKDLFSENKIMPLLKPSDQHETHKDLFSEKKIMPLLKPSDEQDKYLFSAKKLMPLSKSSDQLDKELFSLLTPSKKIEHIEKMTTTASPYFNVLLSVSTIIDPAFKKVDKMPILNNFQKSPYMRKLMQAEEEDDDIMEYDDLNEVLSDGTEAHDDTEKGKIRMKRMHDYPAYDMKVPNNPYYTKPVVNNPAWKGPMPLYPDELTSMIKQAALENVHNANKVKVPSNKDASAVDRLESQLNDMEYIESYSDNKYSKLAKMAQAYSDYGVLEGKKESIKTEKNQAAESKSLERRIKLSVAKGKTVKRSFFDRFKKESDYAPKFSLVQVQERDSRSCPELEHRIRKQSRRKTPTRHTRSEGIRFEVRPTTSSREDDIPLGGSLTQHLKFSRKYKGPAKSPTNIPTNNPTISPTISPIDNFQSQNVDNVTLDGAKKMDTDLALFSSVHRAQKLSEAARLKQKQQKDMEPSTYSLNLVKGKSRSLLSISETDDNDSDYNQSRETDNSYNNTEQTNESSSLERDIVSAATAFDVNAANMKSNNHTTKMPASDLFLLVSSWFSSLSDSAFNYNITKPSGNNSTITSIEVSNFQIQKREQSNKSNDFMYQNYDSDMVENIGHRSRALMSVEDFKENTVTHATTLGKGDDATTANQASDTYADVGEDLKLTSVILTTFPNKINTNETTSGNLETVTLINESPPLKDNNKTVVKRNAIAGGNLIFWNDIYDDEYGVKSDPLDKAIRNKQYGKGMDFVKRSGSWIHDKVRNLANNIRGKDKTDENDYMSKRSIRGAKLGTENNPQLDINKKYPKRSANRDEEGSDGQVTTFETLTLKMKTVCKEAAKAVQQTRNIQIRQNENEDTMTTSLMQQLVRLMTDLIDFQVQQKTCLKLPPDLQEFLGWMTSTNPEKMDTKSSNDELTDEDIDQTSAPARLSEVEDLHPGIKSTYLSVLHSVEELMQQYDEMSEEDKSKMTGVKDYLENQLQYLNVNRQLLGDEFKSLFPSYQDTETPMRFKRYIPYKKYQVSKFKYPKSNREKRQERIKRKFLKNFGKKHTRTTASIYDSFSNTEMYVSITKPGDDSSRISNADKLRSNEADKGPIEEKRNLKDVYYKAVEDAKKYTTIKSIHKKDEVEGFDNARIVRIDK